MISFVIPTKNEELFVGRLFESLQKYHGLYEIIVSDGGSTDGTLDIVRKYTDKVVVWNGDVRQTIAAGRNAGAHIATGRYLVFFDADVYIPDIDALMAGVEVFFQENQNVVAISGSLLVMPECATFFDGVISFILNTYFSFINNVFGVVMVYGEFQITKREAFEKVTGFDEKIVASEDYDLFRRLNNKVGKVKFVKKLKVYHTGRRIHKTGWSKLLFRWFSNWLSVILVNRAKDGEWEEIR